MKYLFLPLLLIAGVQAAEVPPARQTDLKYLLRQDCGSCHGMTLKGGLGPALLPENLQDKPPEYLAAVILYGRPGTAMPPWNILLTEQDATWLADYLKQPGYDDAAH